MSNFAVSPGTAAKLKRLLNASSERPGLSGRPSDGEGYLHVQLLYTGASLTEPDTTNHIYTVTPRMLDASDLTWGTFDTVYAWAGGTLLTAATTYLGVGFGMRTISSAEKPLYYVIMTAAPVTPDTCLDVFTGCSGGTPTYDTIHLPASWVNPEACE